MPNGWVKTERMFIRPTKYLRTLVFSFICFLELSSVCTQLKWTRVLQLDCYSFKMPCDVKVEVVQNCTHYRYLSGAHRRKQACDRNFVDIIQVIYAGGTEVNEKL